MDIDLRKLTFGKPAAERDDGLESYFFESESYRRLRDGERTVVLGARGSGKSALFRMLEAENRRKGAIVLTLAPEDYSYELLQQSLATEKEGAWAKQGAYAAAWKYLIYVATMKKVTAAGKGLKGGPGARIYNYLRDNHANFDVNPIGTLISYLKRLEGFKLGNVEAGARTKELQKLYKLEEVTHLLDDLDELCVKHPVLILVDELDKGWDASEDAVSFVAGLFQAAISINQRTPSVRVVISLRKELYDNIPALYEDAQKVRDIIEELEWDEERLFALITLRIGHSLGRADKPSTENWSAVFAETLDYRQNKSFNYMIDRTLYRPRDIIQLCTQATLEAVEGGSAVPINYDVISRAEHRFSEERLKDIAAEYRFQNPGLLNVFETFRGGPYNLTRDELELHCLAISTGDTTVEHAAREWILDIDPDALIDVLWRVGFIRARAVGGFKARRRSGSEYLGSHQVSNLNLLPIEHFHVHPMFRAFLGLKEKKRAKP